MISLKLAALLGAIFIYALFSSPTPDHPGWAEALTGLLLIAAVGLPRSFSLLTRLPPRGWQRAAWALMIYGLSAPLIAGLFSGNAVGAMLRDIIPFLFFLLPLFLYAPLHGQKHAVPALIAAVCFAGITFALRVLTPVFKNFSWQMAPPADPFYLANAPTVLFAALFLGGMAGTALYRSVRPHSFLRAALFLFLAFIPLAAMALILQRASMGVFAVAMILLLAIGFCKNPRRALAPLCLMLVLMAAFWGPLGMLFANLETKTALVGLNMRAQEARAVMEAIGDSSWAILFGRGWGARFADPAVGGMVVNFTHNLFTSFWLKTGLCGVILAGWYLMVLSLRLWPLLWRRPVLALALAGPLAVDSFLYASFKSLDFGLVLLLIALAGAQFLKESQACSIKD